MSCTTWEGAPCFPVYPTQFLFPNLALKIAVRACLHQRFPPPLLYHVASCTPWSSLRIVDEWKTNLMPLAILFHLLCAQHVSDINISIFRSLVCVDELPHRSSCSQFVVCWSFWCGWFWMVFVLQASACKTNITQNQPHQSSKTQAPEDGYINVQNILST